MKLTKNRAIDVEQRGLHKMSVSTLNSSNLTVWRLVIESWFYKTSWQAWPIRTKECPKKMKFRSVPTSFRWKKAKKVRPLSCSRRRMNKAASPNWRLYRSGIPPPCPGGGHYKVEPLSIARWIKTSLGLTREAIYIYVESKKWRSHRIDHTRTFPSHRAWW